MGLQLRLQSIGLGVGPGIAQQLHFGLLFALGLLLAFGGQGAQQLARLLEFALAGQDGGPQGLHREIVFSWRDALQPLLGQAVVFGRQSAAGTEQARLLPGGAALLWRGQGGDEVGKALQRLFSIVPLALLGVGGGQGEPSF